MQGTYIPETNYVPREYSVAAILLFLFMVLISLVSVLNLLDFYISTFRSMCVIIIIIIIIIIVVVVVVSIQYSRIQNIQCPCHVIVFHFQRQCLCKAQTAAVLEYY
jgi:uncharacterized membrane protein YhaH (DUF805 family)